MKKNIYTIGIIVIVIFAVVVLLREIRLSRYLYRPNEYQESEVFFPEWDELELPIRLEISNDGFRDNYVFIDDVEQVRFVIEELQKSTYSSRSRGEWRDLEFQDHSPLYDDGYHVILRTIDEEGYGNIIFSFEFYDDDIYVYAHSPYYYYTLSEELRSYVQEKID